ncbi:3-oxo-tetronate kinase [Succiniclasticum ruminis]|uniref:3-oxo-tetronate kinase n=1 Tax=Succiniclasticum ruminis DSM 9236 TaxID=1123323 RepID=A0A1I2CLN5_9FIRM|nr:3-oxo-tetronate kinase [Succiniclasticum ruminis]SFE68640.1 Uncharacterized conserved protein YgbK, DUF1537 family [Succiniclasticum ruminis DSM 9236]
MILGCIADDFTGASDAASFLVKGGMRTVLCTGIPADDAVLFCEKADAVVIALKTRTEEPGKAVAESLHAVQWLKEHGAGYFYIKYCSTFDSTEKGNIGPVCDAVLDYLKEPFSLLCPSLPVNGRTVRGGTLYVNGTPLAESHMRFHPLNPMLQSDISQLMKPQSRYNCINLSREQLNKMQANWDREIETYTAGQKCFYFVPDYETDEDGEEIIRCFGHIQCLTGGSGILEIWAKHLLKGKVKPDEALTAETAGEALLIAGSCSQATLRQIARFKETGGVSLKIDPGAVRCGQQTLEGIKEFLELHKGTPVLFYSSETPEYLESIRKTHLQEYSSIVEKTMSDIAVIATQKQYTRFVVAGGETSGAVIKALGYDVFWIGPSISPGVPVMIPCKNPSVRIILKSGNFGEEDFFEKALFLTDGSERK